MSTLTSKGDSDLRSQQQAGRPGEQRCRVQNDLLLDYNLPAFVPIALGIIAVVLCASIVAIANMRVPVVDQFTLTLHSPNGLIRVYAPTGGAIDLVLVHDGERVTSGQILAVVADHGDFRDIVKVANDASGPLENKQRLIDNLHLDLGDIAPAYSTYVAEISRSSSNPLVSKKLLRARQDLQVAVSRWKRQYCIAAPISGSVSFIRPLFRAAPIQQNELLVAIVRPGVPMSGFGFVPRRLRSRIAIGQSVRVEPNNYPAGTSGFIRGKITNIAALSTDAGYMVTVTLPTPPRDSTPIKPEIRGEDQAQAILEPGKTNLFQRTIAPWFK